MNKKEIMIVRPNESIGPIRIGMKKDHVRTIAVVPFEAFVRSSYSNSTTDDFMEIQVHVDYGVDGCSELITSYALDRTQLFGRVLSPLTIAECAAWLKTLGIAFENDDLGLICREAGVSFFAEGGLKYPDDPIKAVHVFKDGYYD